ncbi:MAG: hypothetical protein LBB25_01670 [Holosporaceae bacterium]|nr:hypothetical protein [Holosporaceae bacterium]
MRILCLLWNFLIIYSIQASQQNLRILADAVRDVERATSGLGRLAKGFGSEISGAGGNHKGQTRQREQGGIPSGSIGQRDEQEHSRFFFSPDESKCIVIKGNSAEVRIVVNGRMTAGGTALSLGGEVVNVCFLDNNYIVCAIRIRNSQIILVKLNLATGEQREILNIQNTIRNIKATSASLFRNPYIKDIFYVQTKGNANSLEAIDMSNNSSALVIYCGEAPLLNIFFLLDGRMLYTTPAGKIFVTNPDGSAKRAVGEIDKRNELVIYAANNHYLKAVEYGDRVEIKSVLFNTGDQKTIFIIRKSSESRRFELRDIKVLGDGNGNPCVLSISTGSKNIKAGITQEGQTCIQHLNQFFGNSDWHVVKIIRGIWIVRGRDRQGVQRTVRFNTDDKHIEVLGEDNGRVTSLSGHQGTPEISLP